MISLEELKKKAEEFRNKPEINEKFKHVNKLLNEFLSIYPFRENKKSIDDLTPEKFYNPGGSNYFLLWIEHKLKELAAIGIGNAEFAKNAVEKLERFKELLKISLDDSLPLYQKIDLPWEEIKFWGGDKQVVKKILCCYYFNEILPILKTEHLEHFCRNLGLDFEKEMKKEFGISYNDASVGQKFQVLNNLLINFKNRQEEFKGWNNYLFAKFLYTIFPPPDSSKNKERKEVKPLNPLGLATEPIYEQEVIFLFSKFHKELGFPIIISISPNSYPDAEVLDSERKLKKIEFEVYASDFIAHGHKKEDCDYIVCWENDLKEESEKLPQILALKDLLKF